MNTRTPGSADAVTPATPAPSAFGGRRAALGARARVAGRVVLAASVAAALPSGRYADMRRWWVVTHFLVAGQNPYVTAQAKRERAYGPLAAFKLAERPIHEIPPFAPDELAQQPE